MEWVNRPYIDRGMQKRWENWIKMDPLEEVFINVRNWRWQSARNAFPVLKKQKPYIQFQRKRVQNARNSGAPCIHFM